MKNRWFQIINASLAGKETAEVLLYGPIGNSWDGDGIEAKGFKEDWDRIPKNAEITLRIHSPGGSVFDALAIYNTIAERREKVTAVVDGIAASSASWVALAANKVKMPKTARMMIHNSHGLVMGDRDDMRKASELLEREDERIADIYARKTGKTRNAIQALMDATTWMDGKEAVDMGFADETTDAAAVKNTFDLSVFQRVPEDMEKEKTGQPKAKPEPKKVMNREQLIALLTKHGVTVDNSLTDEALAALLAKTLGDLKNKTEAPKPEFTSEQAPAFVPVDRIKVLEDRLESERVSRITNLVGELCRERQLEPKDWIGLALQNETATIANLRKAPKFTPPEPIHVGIINYGNPLLEQLHRLKDGGPSMAFERRKFRVANFAEIKRRYAEFNPSNLNTIAAGLVEDVLADAVLTVFTNRLAIVNGFANFFTGDPLAPRRPVDVPKATAGSASITNPVNFEVGDSTLNVITVTPAIYSQPFHMDNNAINQGFQLDQIAEINALTLANTLHDVITAQMTTANFGAGTVIGLASAFDAADLAPILGLAKNYRQKILLLDGGHLAYLLPTDKIKWALGEPGAYGFDAIYENNRWTGATTNAAGFVCSKDALAVVAGAPADLPPGEFIAQGSATLLNGLTVRTNRWFSRATRFQWASYDIVFGANVGDGAAGEVLITA